MIAWVTLNAQVKPATQYSSPTGCPVPSGRKEKENGKEVSHSSPFSMYTAPGGLRQGRGRAAQSTVRGQTLRMGVAN